MKILRPISIHRSFLMLTASAEAQVSLTPPGAETPAASKPAAKPKAKPTRGSRKPEAPAVTAKPAAPAAALDRDGDPCPVARRSQCRSGGSAPISAANTRPHSNSPPNARRRTAIQGDDDAGELYANAMGVKRDYATAAEWYKHACRWRRPRGHVCAGNAAALRARRPVNREEAVKLLGVLRQARQPEGGLQSGAAYLARPDAAAGSQARGGVASPRRRRRQSGSAIRARHFL